MLESVQRTEIPPRPVIAMAGEAVADANLAITTLQAWGVRVPPNSRLEQAASLLSAIVATGQFPSQAPDLSRAVAALQAVLDFKDIAKALPGHRIAAVRKELELALSGTIDPDAIDRAPLQLQSQHWVRAVLMKGGIPPRYPKHEKLRPNPDFIFDEGASTYGLEVKRPEKFHNIRPRFDDGVQQLAERDLTGGVFIDATDALRDLPPEDFEVASRELADMLYHTVWLEPNKGWRQGYRHVFFLALIARGTWQVIEGAGPLLSVVNVSNIAVFARRRNTIEDFRGLWIRSCIQAGFIQLGFTEAESA